MSFNCYFLGLLANRILDISGVVRFEILGETIVALEVGGALGIFEDAGEILEASLSVLGFGFDLEVFDAWLDLGWLRRLTEGLICCDTFLTAWTREFVTMVVACGSDVTLADGSIVDSMVMPWVLIDRLKASASWFAASSPSRIIVLILSRCKRSCAIRLCCVERMCSNSCQKLKLISCEWRWISWRSSWARFRSRGTSSLDVNRDMTWWGGEKGWYIFKQILEWCLDDTIWMKSLSCAVF